MKTVMIMLLLTGIALAEEEPRVYTDYDLRQYGAKGSSAAATAKKGCQIVDYATYENVTRTTTTPGRVILNPSIVPGGAATGIVTSPTVRQDKETCMSLKIKNADTITKMVFLNDITVITVKGNVVKPYNGKLDYVKAGETLNVSNLCFSTVLSGISEIQLECD